MTIWVTPQFHSPIRGTLGADVLAPPLPGAFTDSGDPLKQFSSLRLGQ